MDKFNQLMVSTLAVLYGLVVFSQNPPAQICLGADMGVCVGDPVIIEVCPNNPNGFIDTTETIFLNNPIIVDVADDMFSGVIPIGFPFSFYGNSYNTCVIGANGIVSFNQFFANTYCDWSLYGNPLPSGMPSSSLNAAMVCYHDLNPTQGGKIYYQTIGTAPNRMFVVLWANNPMYQTGECAYQSGVFYESSNIIEFYISQKPISFWNGGLAIQGLQNSSATNAVITPGRNNSVWPASMECKVFTPISSSNTTNYTISIGDYKYVIAQDTINNNGVQWENSNGETFPYNNGVLAVYPQNDTDTITYFLSSVQPDTTCLYRYGGCGEPLTSDIWGLTSGVSAEGMDDFCDMNIGNVAAVPLWGQPPFSYFWMELGSTSQFVNNLPAGNYSVEMIDNLGCRSYSSVTIGGETLDYSISSTPPSCSSNNDGTASVIVSSEMGMITYQWDDANYQTTSTATGLAPGTYSCLIMSSTGCSEVAYISVAESTGLSIQIVDVVQPLCDSGNIGSATVQVMDGIAPYTYSWSGSSSTSSTADDLALGIHTITVTDANGCHASETITITATDGPQISVDFSQNISCYGEQNGMISLDVTGGTPEYTFTWLPNVSNSSSAEQLSAGIYTITVTDMSGCSNQIEVELTEPSPLVISSEITDATCQANDGQIALTVSGGVGNYSYEWSPNVSNSHEAFNLTSGEYTVLIKDENNCTFIFTNIVNSNSSFDIYIDSNNEILQQGESMEVEVVIPSNINVSEINWTPAADLDCSDCANPTITPSSTTTYFVEVISTEGCVAMDSIQIEVDGPCGTVFVPTIFSPNGDGTNDLYCVYGKCIISLDLTIFNRWGEPIFHSEDKNDCWDGVYKGKLVQSGVYSYQVAAVLKSGETFREKGSITVIR